MPKGIYRRQPQMSIEERFWSHVQKSEAGCWVWTAARNAGGGMFGVNGKVIRVRHYAYELYYGPVPRGFYVCYCCGNDMCIRPDHLVLKDRRTFMIEIQQKMNIAAHTPEVIEKQAQSRKGHPGSRLGKCGCRINAEGRLRMSLAQRGRIITDDHRKKISASCKKAWALRKELMGQE